MRKNGHLIITKIKSQHLSGCNSVNVIAQRIMDKENGEQVSYPIFNWKKEPTLEGLIIQSLII